MRTGMKRENLTILITGGTGSFGKKFVEVALNKYHPKRLIIFSRDELKQHNMHLEFKDPRVTFFVGDVRDRDRLYRAFQADLDVVIHAAALKQVPSCEYNPFEAVKTNIIGAQNVINAAIDCGVPKVIALSTDKAVNPINLYGATKLCAEKLFIQGNSYVGGKVTRFSCVRYGNVIGSRGSVIPLFKEQRKNGKITITDPRMTRFWITLDEAVELVVKALRHMQGGEIFVPKIPSMKIIDLAQAVAPECEIEFIGIRPGEKLHEMLITEEEGRNTVAYNGMFIIMPKLSWWKTQNYKKGKYLPDNFVYRSDKNDQWLAIEDLREMAQGTLSSEEDSVSHLISTIHYLNEKVVMNLINSEECIADRSV